MWGEFWAGSTSLPRREESSRRKTKIPFSEKKSRKKATFLILVISIIIRYGFERKFRLPFHVRVSIAGPAIGVALHQAITGDIRIKRNLRKHLQQKWVVGQVQWFYKCEHKSAFHSRLIQNAQLF